MLNFREVRLIPTKIFNLENFPNYGNTGITMYIHNYELRMCAYYNYLAIKTFIDFSNGINSSIYYNTHTYVHPVGTYVYVHMYLHKCIAMSVCMSTCM